jgi:flagellar hook-length control protein FliK
MIRRLHLEEVQPPVPTVAAASGLSKSGDDEERKSLALEFKHLLSKVVGQVDALTDEGTALAMALAQAMPAQRVLHHDLQKPQASDVSQENDNEDLLDDGGNERQQLAVGSDEADSDGSGDQGSNTVERETNGADANSGKTIELARSSVATQIETSGELVALNNLSAQADENVGLEEGKDFDIDSSLQSLQSDSQAQQVSSGADTSLQGGNDGSGQLGALAAQGEAVRLKVQDNVNDEADGEAAAELVASQTSEPSATEGDVVRKVVTTQKSQENSDFSQSLNRQADASAHDPARANESNRESQSNLNSRADILPESVTRKRVEDGTRGAQASKELPSAEPEVISPSVSQSSRRGTEGVVQMTILRQAFESLRAARQESSEGQVKPTTPTVSGAAAATGSKRSEDAASSKGSRGMNKGQMARMFERVQSTLTEAAKARDGKTISLRLDPANLGRVKVDVSLKEGTLHARIIPENQQVMTALREHAHELQGALRKLGLDVDSVTVTVRSDGFHEEAASSQNSFDGSTFQQERNNMPHEGSQVVENTVGNELAQWKEAVAPEHSVGVVDHWVA